MGEWNYGLFGCFSNCSVCCFANILAPLTVGSVAHDEVGAKQPILWAMAFAGAPPCLLGLLRTRVRQKYGIAGSNTTDCCASLLCAPCVITQLSLQDKKVNETITPMEQDMNRAE